MCSLYKSNKCIWGVKSSYQNLAEGYLQFLLNSFDETSTSGSGSVVTAIPSASFAEKSRRWPRQNEILFNCSALIIIIIIIIIIAIINNIHRIIITTPTTKGELLSHLSQVPGRQVISVMNLIKYNIIAINILLNLAMILILIRSTIAEKLARALYQEDPLQEDLQVETLLQDLFSLTFIIPLSSWSSSSKPVKHLNFRPLRRRKSPWLDTKKWNQKAFPSTPDLKIDKIDWFQHDRSACDTSWSLYWPKQLK